MSEIKSIDAIMQDTLLTFDKEFLRKLISQAIFTNWEKIAGKFSKDLVPVKIKDDVLILHAKTSAARDNLKFIAKDILDNANNFLASGEVVLRKIDYAKTFEMPSKILKKISRPKKNSPSLNDIQLTDEEISECKKLAAEIIEPKIQQMTFVGLINRKKAEKLKLADGWHKCKCCNSLCKPEEIICDFCRISERNKMRREIRKIFYQKPSTKFFEVLQFIRKKFSHIAEEVSLEVITSERNALINSVAAKVPFGDTKSELAKFLVMLYCQLPKEKLTDAIVNRTLKELRFNLSNQPPFEVREFKKFSEPNNFVKKSSSTRLKGIA